MKLADLKSMKPDALIRFALVKAEKELDCKLDTDTFPRKKILKGEKSVRVRFEYPIAYAPKKTIAISAIEVNLKDDKVTAEYIRNPRKFDIKKRIPLYKQTEENNKLCIMAMEAIKKNTVLSNIVSINGRGVPDNTTIAIRENNLLLADVSITIEATERNFSMGWLSAEFLPTYTKEIQRDPFYDIEKFEITTL